jgi:hypothetical protein
MLMMNQRLRRKANLIYRLRKKNVVYKVETKKLTIYTEYGFNYNSISEIRSLMKEFHFVIQPVILRI